ncbi:cryptochrome/photolyase family protein [Polycladidibacter stylochi]|uniref:cryptochrome/photolyase family protein n=1 Tax=Polycladidibacter stylochi TaxID=1807766 RepID=UPI0008365697|nr:deoxyribodipyrimidine photo-lyase [Pseudovibrio stylochi]
MASEKSIMWFRQDLRLKDNPALREALASGPTIAVYILDDESAGDHQHIGASRLWLHHALTALESSLNGKLLCLKGNSTLILQSLCAQHNVASVYSSFCCEPWRIRQDEEVREALAEQNVQFHQLNSSFLWWPQEINKPDGSPYKVFTPFYRRGCLTAKQPRKPLLTADTGKLVQINMPEAGIAKLRLLSGKSWEERVLKSWQVSEEGAEKQLLTFLKEGLTGYKNGRNYPSLPHISKLSPFLRHGQISPNTVWWAVANQEPTPDNDHFLSEIGWREFSNNLLFHNNKLPEENFRADFSQFEWEEDPQVIKRWQRGETGVPIVDAGMRELWQTGFMHNRVRMIVASYLTKNLRQHWRAGANWFWKTLVDADLANNSASWQWVAGCGADAAPYFRIFNPVTQAQKFDPEGVYIKTYLPELKRLSGNDLFAPWQAPQQSLLNAGVLLGENYPKPMIDLAASRKAALAAYEAMKGK